MRGYSWAGLLAALRSAGQAEVLELLAQRALEELAGGGPGNRLDADEGVRELPLGELAAQEGLQLLVGGGGSLADDHAGHRPLRPFGVPNGDHRGLADGRVA